MSELRILFDKWGCDKGRKHGYEECYEQFFEPVKNEKINILEVGIFKGRSLEVFREYFPNAQIYGIDIFTRVTPNEPRLVRLFANKNVHWAMCDSTDPKCVSEITKTFGKNIEFDIIIDDGLHEPEANALTLKNLWPLLKSDGIYFVEDVWPLDEMSTQDIEDHVWLNQQPEIYSNEKYNLFLKQLENKHVERFDLRKPSTSIGHVHEEGDSYIFKVMKNEK